MDTLARAVEVVSKIQGQTCPTWSHFIQDKLNLSFPLTGTNVKLIKFYIIITSSHVALKTVWILISWLLKKPADLDIHCFQES